MDRLWYKINIPFFIKKKAGITSAICMCPVASNSLITLFISISKLQWMWINARPVNCSSDMVIRRYVFNLLRLLHELSAVACEKNIKDFDLIQVRMQLV